MKIVFEFILPILPINAKKFLFHNYLIASCLYILGSLLH